MRRRAALPTYSVQNFPRPSGFLAKQNSARNRFSAPTFGVWPAYPAAHLVPAMMQTKGATIRQILKLIRRRIGRALSAFAGIVRNLAQSGTVAFKIALKLPRLFSAELSINSSWKPKSSD